jgi:hypothetical protein
LFEHPRYQAPVLTPRIIWVAILAACAGSSHLRQGDERMAVHDYGEALRAYERALQEDPGAARAREGLRLARRALVGSELSASHKALEGTDYATALRHALRARSMPLDLDEVPLVQRIDDMVAKASRGAEEQVERWMTSGLFVPAVELAERIVDASPGVESRVQWAAQVRARAAAHHSGLAKELSERGLHGSAALQLAMARRVGVDVDPMQVIGAWDRFAEPICFAPPVVELTGPAKVPPDVQAALVAGARATLAELSARCGIGKRKLEVRYRVDAFALQDDVATLRAAKPLPGVQLKTVETYYEETPYREIEEYTEYETRVEQQEKRDCAPRPGQPRGCRTWVEDVEVKVPIQKSREVEKVRRVEKTRPVKGPFPADKVVEFDEIHVQRRVALSGELLLNGQDAGPFELRAEAEDRAHAAVTHPKMHLPVDPMEAKSIAELVASVVERAASDLGRVTQDAVATWTAADGDEARKRVLEGQLPQAEELYLKRLALGADDDPKMRAFFQDRYGKSLAAVMDILAAAMGQSPDRRPPGDEASAKASFPRRGSLPEPQAAPPPAQPVEAAAPTPVAKPADVSSMESTELDALEAESLGETEAAKEDS